MNERRRQLIEKLTGDLQPVRSLVSPVQAAVLWWIATWIYVTGITLMVAPLRPGVLLQAGTHGQFFVESVLGLAAAAIVAVFAFGDSIPGNSRRPLLTGGLVMAAVWVSAYVIGLEFPALPPSMAGKRPGCVLEALVYAAPPALAGIFLCRRYYVLAPLRTTALVALTAAMVPALLMQFACMYDPAHILSHHILPIPLTVAAAVAVHGLILVLRRARR